MKQKLIRKIMQIQDELVREMYGEVIRPVPMDTGEYLESIDVRLPELKGNIISSSVFSNLMVDSDGWRHIPLASFIEYGTGFLGLITNDYPHGHQYRLDMWTYFNERYGRWITTTGRVAVPHFYPALQATIPKYKRALEKAFK